MSRPTRKELIEALGMVEDYVNHKESCTYSESMTRTPGDDFCSCDVGEVVSHIDELLTEYSDQQASMSKPRAYRGREGDVKTELDVSNRRDGVAIVRCCYPTEEATQRRYEESIIHEDEIPELIELLEGTDR